MGCDIHIYTEKKRKDKWLCCDYYTVNHWYDEDDTDEDSWEQPFNHTDFYDGRNYELFGALAGVRREDISHISPKGFPDNASKECLEDFTQWGSDAHTPSWLTLTQLKEHQYSIGSTIKRSCMISPEQAKDLERGIKPNNWCGWTNQTEYVHAEWEDEGNPLDEFMQQLNDFMKMRFYSYELDQMDDNDFRVVFWFDN